MTILTGKFELYPDSLTVYRPMRGWGGGLITVPRTWDRPEHMGLSQWRDHALSIVARELPDEVSGPAAPTIAESHEKRGQREFNIALTEHTVKHAVGAHHAKIALRCDTALEDMKLFLDRPVPNVEEVILMIDQLRNFIKTSTPAQ